MKKTCDIVKRFLNKYSKLKSAYTLTEVVVVMLVVAVVVSVSIKITKVKLDNIISYTYYSGYSTLRSVTGQVLADFKNDEEYLDVSAYENILNTQLASTNRVKFWSKIAKLLDTQLLSQPAFAFDQVTTDKFGDPYNNSPKVTCPAGQVKCDATSPGAIMHKTTCGSPGCEYAVYFCCPSAPGPSTYIPKCGSKTCSDGKTLNFLCQCVCNKTCGDNETLNSSTCTCEPNTTPPSEGNPEPETCTTPSEAEQQVHRCQNQEEWKGEPTCGYVPITCPEGNHWSVNSCGCVPESPTLPRKGINFCRKFVSYTNTKSNSPECTGTAISSTETDFSDKTADITLRNGMRIYNMSQNPQEIGILEGNTQGASYDGVPNINTFGYTVYLDIDGEKGSSTLWEDVYKFYITMAGKVIPAYDENNPNEEVGGNSRRHLMTSVEKEAIVDGRRQMRWLKKSVTFKEGACTSNYLGASSRYCNGVNILPDCNDPINPCLMKHVSPVKFF